VNNFSGGVHAISAVKIRRVFSISKRK